MKLQNGIKIKIETFLYFEDGDRKFERKYEGELNLNLGSLVLLSYSDDFNELESFAKEGVYKVVNSDLILELYNSSEFSNFSKFYELRRISD